MKKHKLLIVLAVTMLTALSASAQTFTVLYSFTGSNYDSGFPTASLIHDAAGNLYSTAYFGGNNQGIVFELDTTNVFTNLYTFNGGDGSAPLTAPILDSDGTFYGITNLGGPYDGCGVVYKLDPTGTETVLHYFDCGNGREPLTLIRDAGGNFYGTTFMGGEFTDCGRVYGCGVAFKLDTQGRFKVLHSFSGGGYYDGAGIYFRDGSGVLYGLTGEEGSAGLGALFKIDPKGNFTVLHSFQASEGTGFGGLIRDEAGNFYGTSLTGGINGLGSIFKIDSAGTLTVLYSFRPHDGIYPSGLIRDSKGILYGSAVYGGDATCQPRPRGCGTAFQFDPVSGKFKRLHSFTWADGIYPNGLAWDGFSKLVGMASEGGDYGYGTIFRITRH